MRGKTSTYFSLIYSFFLLLPDLFNITAPSTKGYIATVMYALIHYWCLSYGVCFMIKVVTKRMPKVFFGLHVLLHIILLLYSISSVFLFILFNMQWNEITFQLIRETTTKECNGFLSAYGTSNVTCIIVVSYLLLLAIEAWIYRKFVDITILSKYKNIVYRFIIILLLFNVWLLRFYISPNNISYADRFIVRTGLWNFARSVKQFNDNIGFFDICAQNQVCIEIDSVGFTSKNIILVIGESHIRHHSQLYGYNLETNPYLSQEELYVFKDVISSYNVTSESFKDFLSLSNVDEMQRQWYEAPLFPSIFKQAGYNVVFYSNQFVPEGYQGSAEASAGFMNLPSIAPNMFSHRNLHREPFDGDLIDKYKEDRVSLEGDNNLIIFHLFGQHYPAEIQVPGNHFFFSQNDESRADLNERERLDVSNYDNATRYNDFVLKNVIDLWRNEDAIIIYFSDHGDEIHDFRSKIGRSFDFATGGAKVVHCQLDIPFLVYVTDLYKKDHPEIIRKLQSSIYNHFMTDDLSHMLLELAGIKTPWFNPTRSLINENFNNNRKRKVNHLDLYYEDICIDSDSVFHVGIER